MWRIHSKALLVKMNMDGRQHSAIGALPHPFDAQMRLHEMWVPMCSIASTSVNHFAAVAQGLRYGPAERWIHFKIHVVKMDMDGRQNRSMREMSHPFDTKMSLHKLWVAMGRIASTSANHIAAVAKGLRFGPSQNVDPFQGASGEKGHG